MPKARNYEQGESLGNIGDKPEKGVWRFGVIPDTQGTVLEDGIVHAPTLLLDAVVKKLVDEKVDLVLAVGDITDKRRNLEYKEWLQAIKPLISAGIKVFPVRGNHEIVDGKDWTHWMEDGEDHVEGHYDSGLKMWNNYMSEFITFKNGVPGMEEVTYYFIHNHTLFIAIDFYGVHLVENIYGSSWIKIYPWLKEVIERHSSQVEHIIVFGHEPLSTRKRPHAVNDEEYFDLMNPECGKMIRFDISQLGHLALQNRAQPGLMNDVLQLFANYKVQYISGHDHQYSRSLIYPNKSDKMAFFHQIIAGNVSFRNHDNRYGINKQYETGIAQDNFSGQTKKATILIVEISGRQMTTKYLYAKHNFFPKDQFKRLKWENPQWELGDKISYTTDATQYVVPPRGNYWIYSEAKDSRYLGTNASIFEGYNMTFNSYEAIGEHLTLSKVDHMSKLISLSWFKKNNPNIVSDILLIDGMSQQDGYYADAKGNQIEENPFVTDQICAGNRTGKMDKDDKVDPYVLALSVPKDIVLESVILGHYNESKETWEVAVDMDSFVPTFYSDDFARGDIPDHAGVTERSSMKLWGYNYHTHSIWGFVNVEGKFAIIKKH